MRVNIINKKLIKPCTPTPQHLTKYKISLSDELSPPMNVSVILFYPPNLNPNPTTRDLEDSLAEILPRFYPFAGRYMKNDHSVDCNDEGAEFVRAQAVGDVKLMDIIAKTTKSSLFSDHLLTRHTYDNVDEPTDPLLSIQVTEFKCGGLVISISMSHRIVDAYSIRTFVAAWSDANMVSNQSNTISPSFDTPSLFPGINLDYNSEPPHKVVVKRLLFNKEAISTLRSKLQPNDGKRILSRVRLVSALIAKALIGVEVAKNGKSRDYFIGQAVNIRERTIPPLPEHSIGNLAFQSMTQCMAANDPKEVGFQELVSIIGDAIDKMIHDCADFLSLGIDGRVKIILDPIVNVVERLTSERGNFMGFTDWSKFGFYDVDFGWGKPVWVGIGTMQAENITLLIDNKEGDGIEAWVYLNQNDVPLFEQDDDMKLFMIA